MIMAPTSPACSARYRAGDWPMGAAGEAHLPPCPIRGWGCRTRASRAATGFVAYPDAAADLRSLGATLVDMEVGAVAQAAARLGKPWAAIKAVTDEANDASGGDDFQADLVRAARTGGAGVERLVAMIDHRFVVPRGRRL